MQDRRIEPRLLCAELVEIHWKDRSGRPRRRVANLEDISLSGICLQVEQGVPEGTLVSMRYGDGELIGVVRYCVERDDAFFLGVQFEEGCRWSTQHFRPQHLLDPAELVHRTVRRHEASPTASLPQPAA